MDMNDYKADDFGAGSVIGGMQLKYVSLSSRGLCVLSRFDSRSSF